MKQILFILSFVLCAGASGTSLAPTKAMPVERVLVIAAASIAISTSTSLAIPMNGLSLVGIQLPAAFTGTAITFTGAVDSPCTTYQAVYSTTSGTALSYTVAQGQYIAIDPAPFYGLKCIKLVSGSTEAAARAFTVSLKGI